MKGWCSLLLGLLALPLTAQENHYQSVVRDASGNAVPGATITVFVQGGSTPALLWRDRAGTVVQGNPFVTDSLGNYSFYLVPGRYRILASKVGVGTFTADDVEIGPQPHASSHQTGGDPLPLQLLPGLLLPAQVTPASITAAQVSPSAAIPEGALALNFPTHSNANDPNANQHSALAGSAGLPSGANPYVTSSDSRLTNPRTPTAHGATHGQGQSDPVTVTMNQVTGLASALATYTPLSGLPALLQQGGSRQLSVQGLPGQLPQAQPVQVLRNGSAVATLPTLNFRDGTGSTVSVVQSGSQLDIAYSVPASLPNLAVYSGITPVTGNTSILAFQAPGFSLNQSPAGEANVSLDLATLATGGDLTGFLSGPSVIALQGRAVSSATPADGYPLTWVASTGRWTPVAANANSTAIQGRAVCSSPAPGDGQALVWSATNSCFQPGTVSTAIQVLEDNVGVVAAAGSVNFGTGFDVANGGSGRANVTLDLSEVAVSAASLQGIGVSSSAPTSGAVLKYNGTSWAPGTDLSSGSVGLLNNGITVLSSGQFNLLSPLLVTDQGGGQAGIAVSPASIGSSLLNAGTGAGQVSTDSIPQGSTNLYWSSSLFNTALAGSSTTNLAEGTNLYWTPTRFNTSFAGKTTDSLTQGSTNLYWSSSLFNTALAGKTTDNLPQGATNLYLTTAQRTNLTALTGGGDASALHTHTLSSLPGSLSTSRIGNASHQTKVWLVQYPTTGTQYSYVYFPDAVTVTQVAARTRGSIGNCGVNVVANGTNVLSSDLQATASGVATASLASSGIGAGTWAWLQVGTCDPDSHANPVTELTVTLVYNVN